MLEASYEIDNPNLSYQTKLDLWETGFGLQKGRWTRAVGLYAGFSARTD